MLNSKVRLVENMQFVATADSGHAVVMDGPPNVGGNNTGSKPSELLLMAFGGCSGMDVISILRKKQQKVTGLEINVSGDMADGHPSFFNKMHIEYVITGKNISEEAVKRAIDLSLNKYCLVGATIEKSAEITHSYKIVQEAE
jgi:putative redox protein